MASCTDFPYGFIELRDGAGQEEFDWYAGSINATRVFWGDWSQRLNFLQQFLIYVTNAKGNILVAPSAVYPDLLGLIPLRAKLEGKLEVGHAGASGMISFQKVKITITYGIPPLNNTGGGNKNPVGGTYQPFLVEEGSASAEYETFVGPFRDNDGQIIIGLREIRKVIGKEDISVTQLYAINPPWNLFGSLIGKINNTDFYLPSGSVFAQAKVVYYGYAYNQKFLFDGTPAWEIHHKFGARDAPRWDQKYVKNATTGFPELVLLPTDPGVADSDDLNQIFLQDIPV